MVSCDLQDLGYEGCKYTWSNGRGGQENIQCRLDLGLAIVSLINRFPTLNLAYLPYFGSDHLVVRIELDPPSPVNPRKKVRLFRFEEVWARDSRCEEIIRELWTKTSSYVLCKIEGIHKVFEILYDVILKAVGLELRRIEKLLQEE